MLTKEEYLNGLAKMFDTIRSFPTGEPNCDGVLCSDCPFHKGNACNTNEPEHVFEVIQIVEDWLKRPIVTRADKFEEVFGFRPIHCYEKNAYSCPHDIGSPIQCITTDDGKYCDCEKCRKDFWESEYTAPNDT